MKKNISMKMVVLGITIVILMTMSVVAFAGGAVDSALISELENEGFEFDQNSGMYRYSDFDESFSWLTSIAAIYDVTNDYGYFIAIQRDVIDNSIGIQIGVVTWAHWEQEFETLLNVVV